MLTRTTHYTNSIHFLWSVTPDDYPWRLTWTTLLAQTLCNTIQNLLVLFLHVCCWHIYHYFFPFITLVIVVILTLFTPCLFCIHLLITHDLFSNLNRILMIDFPYRIFIQVLQNRIMRPLFACFEICNTCIPCFILWSEYIMSDLLLRQHPSIEGIIENLIKF